MKNLLKCYLLLIAVAGISVTNAQVPALSSYPSASAVIFLDFDGHTVDGTSWNYAGPIICGASGLDNSQITTVFNRVAEDYRPFDINITTDSTKYLAASATKRMRVIATVTSDWYGSAGGVAFVGSFNWGDDNPCFVFSALLGYNIKNISEAIAHEAGHTLGLYHQASYDVNCVKTSDYNYGVGSGEISWAPIMGVGYYRNSTTWYNGPNSYGCTNYQNDMSVLSSTSGITYRTDDYGEAFGTATDKPFVNNEIQINGLIATSTDRDIFKFTLANTKRVVINAIPSNVGEGNSGSNLDISMQLFNNATTSIGIYNPELCLNATTDTVLNPGNYYIRIEGVGNLNTPDYGSLGEYSINVLQSQPIALPLRKLELRGGINGDKHQLTWTIDADEQVTEQILEISTDGNNFSLVTQPATGDRSFYYKPFVTSLAQYRLGVTFDNGRKYYSNIISIRQVNIPKPKLVSNMISNYSIAVTSPGTFSYMIYDVDGKTVRKGQLTNGFNTINTSGITSGLYVISFGNQTNQWTEKLILH